MTFNSHGKKKKENKKNNHAVLDSLNDVLNFCSQIYQEELPLTSSCMEKNVPAAKARQ